MTRVWVLPGWLGPGTVGVTFVCDVQTSGPAPSATTVAAVQAAIDGQRPVTAAVTVFAPTLDAIALTLAINPDTAANRASVLATLADHFAREAAPGGTLYYSRLVADLQSAGPYRLVLSSPAADVVSAPGHLAVPGAITWGVYP